MSRFAMALFACVVASVLMDAALMPSPAEAARLSKAEKVALKQAVTACKAQAKGRKVKWLARRKYVNRCVAEALKDHPNMDVTQMLKKRPNLTDLPAENWPGY
jgi:hypothetical protein